MKLERAQSQVTDLELNHERRLVGLSSEHDHEKEKMEKHHRHELEEAVRGHVIKLEASAAKMDEQKMNYHSKLAETKEKYIKEINRVSVNRIINNFSTGTLEIILMLDLHL